MDSSWDSPSIWMASRIEGVLPSQMIALFSFQERCLTLSSESDYAYPLITAVEVKL